MRGTLRFENESHIQILPREFHEQESKGNEGSQLFGMEDGESEGKKQKEGKAGPGNDPWDK